MDRGLRGRSVKGAGGVGHEDLNSDRPRELGAQHWAAVAGWGIQGTSSWRSLISSEHNQRCIHRFTIHNLQYTTSPTRRTARHLSRAVLAAVVPVLHQMDTRPRCDDGLVICTQSVPYLSRTPVPGLSDHNLMFTSPPPAHSVPHWHLAPASFFLETKCLRNMCSVLWWHFWLPTCAACLFEGGRTAHKTAPSKHRPGAGCPSKN